MVVSIRHCDIGTSNNDNEIHCRDCAPEVRRLRSEVRELRQTNGGLLARLRWAMDCKRDAEVALFEQDQGQYSGDTSRCSFETDCAADVSGQSHINFVSQHFSTRRHITHQVQETTQKHNPDTSVSVDLERQLAEKTEQFRSLADKYNELVGRFQDSQNELYGLSKQNLQLQASNLELLGRLTARGSFQTQNDSRLLVSSTAKVINHQMSLGTSPSAGCVVPPSCSPIRHSRSTGSEVEDVELLNVCNPMSMPLLKGMLPAHEGLPIRPKGTELSHLELKLNGSPQRFNGSCKRPDSASPTSVLVFESTPKKPHGTQRLNSISSSPRDLAPMMTACLHLERKAEGEYAENSTASPNATRPNKLSTFHGSPTRVPKSISIRASVAGNSSLGLRKVVNSSEEAEAVPRPCALSPLRPHRLRLATPVGKDHVYAESREEDVVTLQDVECDAYQQGMYKTELCNKWQNAGECPYGVRCQFAHGMGELRIVLRHPRYKTELCRMVAAGQACPYRHRCHFRHVITEEEKMAIMKLLNQ